VADICRLTCIEQGLAIVDEPNVPALEVHGLKVVFSHCGGHMSEITAVVVTGGAGYIGSLLTAQLLQAGHKVTVIDNLLFGGESLLTFLSHPNFHFAKADVTEPRSLRDSLPRGWSRPDAIIHLAGIVGFPACQAVGKQAAWKFNVEATKNGLWAGRKFGGRTVCVRVDLQAATACRRWESGNGESPLNPQSLYAETKNCRRRVFASERGARISAGDPLWYFAAHTL